MHDDWCLNHMHLTKEVNNDFRVEDPVAELGAEGAQNYGAHGVSCSYDDKRALRSAFSNSVSLTRRNLLLSNTLLWKYIVAQGGKTD